MATWDQGYHSETDYTFGYYRDVSPIHATQQLLLAGYDFQQKEDFKYLELGFGQGVSLNVHAAAGDGEYWGVDFNPNQAVFAQTVAEQAGSGAIALEASFEEFLNRKDVPKFDLIAIHGIFSWVSDENRRIIREISRRYLKPGGALFVSYNAYPGWAPGRPIRDMLRLVHERRRAAGDPPANSLKDGFAILKELQDLGAAFFKRNPAEAKRLEALMKKDPSYLTHEYLNAEWTPFYFRDVARHFAEAKLSFAAPAHILDLLNLVNLPKKAADYIESFQDVEMREAARDYLTCQQFRRDYFIRGTRKLSREEQGHRLDNQYITIGKKLSPEKISFHSQRGAQKLNADTVKPIFDALLEKGGTIKIADLRRSKGVQSLNQASVNTALLILTQLERVRFSHKPDITERNTARAQTFNRTILAKGFNRSGFRTLASPIDGAGVNLNDHQLIMLESCVKGATTPNQMADIIIKLYGENTLPLKRDEKRLTGKAYKDTLTKRCGVFVQNALPFIRRMKLIDV